MSTCLNDCPDRIATAVPDTIEAVLAMFPPEQPQRTTSSPRLSSEDEEVRKARRALRNVPADDYDVWVHAGMALKATFPDSIAASLWDEWARRSPKFDEAEVQKHWKSFGNRHGGKTIAYIYWLAKQAEPCWWHEWRREEEARPEASATAAAVIKDAVATAARPRSVSASDVIDRWEKHGPLVHMPTGLPLLDQMTGGGPVFGTRLYVMGAPDAGKTALVVQILDEFLIRGLAVGLLAVDEEPDDVLQRFLQRRGWTREQCERRDPADLALMRLQVATLPLRLYDSTHSIEAAGEDLAAFARREGLRAAFGVDSIQTARCAIEDETSSRYETVTARVQAIRKVATEHDMITIATSEMSRAAYRSVAGGDRINDMAAAKESGAIEYSARIAVALRGVEGEADLIELRVVKNKHGRSHGLKEAGIHLRIDRMHQKLSEDETFVAPPQDSTADAKAARKDQESLRDAALIAVTLARSPGLPAKDCEEAMIAATPGGMGPRRYMRARGTLGPALVKVDGFRTAKHLYLNGAVLRADVLAEVPLPDMPIVVAARVPTPAAPSRSEALPVALERLKHNTRERRSPPPVRGGSGSGGASHDTGVDVGDDLTENGSASTTTNGDHLQCVANEDDGRPEQPRRRRGNVKAKVGAHRGQGGAK